MHERNKLLGICLPVGNKITNKKWLDRITRIFQVEGKADEKEAVEALPLPPPDDTN